MTSAQVIGTPDNNNSYFQNYPHPDDHTIQTIYKVRYVEQFGIKVNLGTFANFKSILSKREKIMI